VTRQSAERAVTVSALVVFGVYFYRLLSEGHSSSGGGLLQLGGLGAPANVGRFITGWGFAFFVLAVITEAAPSFGGSLAILVATGDVLANGGQVATDVNHKLGAPDLKPAGGKTAQQLSAHGIGQPLAHPLAVPTIGQAHR
jgi:hypothetical protein